MNFGQAIEALKDGKKVARSGWNGKNMFIYLVQNLQLDPMDLNNECAWHVLPEVKHLQEIKICSHIDMKAADDSIVIGWLASQADMLSEDWNIIDD